VFLGEYLDFQVKVNERILLARVHPRLRTPIGDPIKARLNPQKCIAIADSGEGARARAEELVSLAPADVLPQVA